MLKTREANVTPKILKDSGTNIIQCLLTEFPESHYNALVLLTFIFNSDIV